MIRLIAFLWPFWDCNKYKG